MKIVICHSGLTANLLSQAIYEPKYIYSMGYSTKPSEPVNKLANDKNQKGIKETPQELSQREKFKILAKEYGITVVIFHIGISLISLAACYAAVARFVFTIIFNILLYASSSLFRFDIFKNLNRFIIKILISEV